MSTLIYLWGQGYAYYWHSVAKLRALPLAVAFVIVPYAAITWPYRYDFSIYQDSPSMLGSAAVLFALSIFIRKGLISKVVELQDASPMKNSRILFAKYPPTERLDILGWDAATIVLILLPILML